APLHEARYWTGRPAWPAGLPLGALTRPATPASTRSMLAFGLLESHTLRWISAAAIAATVISDAREADACGGCFHDPAPENVTQVTGHRMVFSVSPSATTLWDQIHYSGDPASFAWVLPIRGEVDVGLSSDLLFAELD